MADDAERTEPATPRRRQEARSRGQVARSQDLTASILLLVGLLVLDLLGGPLFQRLLSMTHALLGGGGPPSLRGPEISHLGALAMKEMFALLLPFLALLFVAGLVAALLQTGLLLTLKPVVPDLTKLNPVSGFKRLFSGRTFVNLISNVAKMGIVSAVVYSAITGHADRILHIGTLALPEMVAVGIEIFFAVGLRVALVLLALGVLDWLYQRYRYEKDLRMSKQEVKDELRRMDGDPLMKRRRREVQIKLALQRIRQDVPRADVVVTNPAHLAVALGYDPQQMSAPRVLAKGEGYVAQRIREIALAAGVPVVEKKPLARALYHLVEVGQEVPPQLYQAVAEVLAYVYELSGRRRPAV